MFSVTFKPFTTLATTVIISTLVAFAGSVYAATPTKTDRNTLLDIQHQWARCQYSVTDSDQQQSCFKSVIGNNQKALDDQPDNTDLIVWLGINKASLAGAEGGLGALSLVKSAKLLFEQAIATDPNSLDGSAYASLGSLYYQVPGWPIAFGDDDSAKAMLQKALAINPNSIDNNYFYADFLAQEGDNAQALQYLKKAQQAAPRPQRPLADKGRREDIEKLLKTLQ